MQSSFFTMYFCFFNFLFIVSIVSVYVPERSCVLPLCHVPSADWQMPTKKMHKWQTSSEFRTTEQAAQPKNLRGNWKMCVHSRLGSLSLSRRKLFHLAIWFCCVGCERTPGAAGSRFKKCSLSLTLESTMKTGVPVRGRQWRCIHYSKKWCSKTCFN